MRSCAHADDDDHDHHHDQQLLEPVNANGRNAERDASGARPLELRGVGTRL